MTPPELLMIVASIMSVRGHVAEVDLGQSDGLIEGVEGQAYYQLTVAGQPRRIEVGRATVTATDESTATIRVAANRPLYPGQKVEFEIAQPQPSSIIVAPEPLSSEPVSAQSVPVESPPAQVIPAPILTNESVDQSSMDQATAPLVLDESSSVANAVDSATRMEHEAEPIEAKPLKAKPALQSPDPPAASPVATDATATSAIAVTTITMNTIDGGAHWVGLDPTQAEFFNQTPRFATEINPYRIDLRPSSDRPRSTLRGVTYFEAERQCGQRGARLPTEYEWEVAASHGQLEFVEGLLEWTASWYLPYPGNTKTETEYGQRFRVLRGSPAGASVSPHDRRFMAPDRRHSQVGFRCVEETP